MTSAQDRTEKRRTFFDTEPTVRVIDPITTPLPRPRAMPPPVPRRSTSAKATPSTARSAVAPTVGVATTASSTRGAIDGEEVTRMFTRTEKPPNRWSLSMLAGIAAGLVGIVVPIMCLLSIRDADRPATPTPAPGTRSSSSVLVSLPVSSAPAGASVTLIADGTATVLGRTPTTVSLEPSRAYDIVIALHGHETAMLHLVPHETTAVAVELTEIHESVRSSSSSPN